ncbi:hypothetical protein [Cryobacterium psychrophilum]|uniref:hypothetical protein n=1 Tax=Cryobacterium psychrophilum TaxID=41988 RepID=UPI0010EA27BB|nr:hypothetical protein [Cryobacterium psychrophilum]TDW30392.1 hypothetical protein EDD25_2144 [Cryobacterium psychrophilum]
MNRIDIVYDNRPYSLGGRTIESVRLEIETAIANGDPYWLQVNSGEGRYEDAYLLIAPGSPIALVNAQANGGSTQPETAESSIPDGL